MIHVYPLWLLLSNTITYIAPTYIHMHMHIYMISYVHV